MDHHLSLHHQREHLTRSVVDALRDIPGAISLHTFGSAARGEADCYSDLDLQVITSDLDRSLRARDIILRRVAPVSLEWVITESPTSWAASVLLEGCSPYHKLDIGFCTEDADDKAPLLEGSVRNWSQTPSTARLKASTPACSPAMGSVEHIVVGELLGLTRYVKARRRSQALVCWKFFSALMNRVLLFQFITAIEPCRSPTKPLVTHEITALQRQLSPALRDELAGAVAIASRAAMDRSVVHLARMLAHVAFDGKPASVACQRDINRLLSWLQDELGIQDEPHALSPPCV